MRIAFFCYLTSTVNPIRGSVDHSWGYRLNRKSEGIIFLYLYPLSHTANATGEKCTMYPYTETETPLSILSPCVSIRKYRGSARRARGLNNSRAKMQKNYTHRPSPNRKRVTNKHNKAAVLKNNIL